MDQYPPQQPSKHDMLVQAYVNENARVTNALLNAQVDLTMADARISQLEADVADLTARLRDAEEGEAA